MAEKILLGVLNASVAGGIGIAFSGILVSACGKRYSAGGRKFLWIWLAVCLFLPLYLLPEPIVYRVKMPYVVLKAEITTNEIFCVVWAGVSLALAVFHVVGNVRMRRRIKRWSIACADKTVEKTLADVCFQIGLKKLPEVRILNDSESGPFTLGIWKNTIVLPGDVPEESDLPYILKHEVVHCRNKDILYKGFFLATCIVYWFNPLVWLLRRLAEQDMEIVCDKTVMRNASETEKKEYSEIIMAWVEKSGHKKHFLSTEYVHGVQFLQRRFDNILGNAVLKKGGVFFAIVGILAVGAGGIIRIEGGKAVYARREIPVDSGIEIRTDLDGDGKTDRVRVYDVVQGDNAYTQVIGTLYEGVEFFVDYPDSWTDSYLITGDLNGDGAADVVVVRRYTGSAGGSCTVSVLHAGVDESGQSSFTEYPCKLIRNPDQDDAWERYTGSYIPDEEIDVPQPDSFSPENMDFCCVGATVIEKDGGAMLRLVQLVDVWTETVKCIDCSYREEGWYIEAVQIVSDYWAADWEKELLSGQEKDWEVEQVNVEDGTVVIPSQDFWEETGTDNVDDTVTFITGLVIGFPESWQDKIVLETDVSAEDSPVDSILLVCEEENADAGIGGILFYLRFLEYTGDVYTLMDFDEVLGIYKQGDKKYVLIRGLPGDRQYSEEDEALIEAYESLMKTMDDVVIETNNMQGFTELGWIQKGE